MSKFNTSKAHDVASVVNTLYKSSGTPVQQDEVAKAIGVSASTARKYLLQAMHLRLIHDLEIRNFMPSRLVPYKAIEDAFPLKKKPSIDVRAGWLF